MSGESLFDRIQSLRAMIDWYDPGNESDMVLNLRDEVSQLALIVQDLIHLLDKPYLGGSQ